MQTSNFCDHHYIKLGPEAKKAKLSKYNASLYPLLTIEQCAKCKKISVDFNYFEVETLAKKEGLYSWKLKIIK